MASSENLAKETLLLLKLYDAIASSPIYSASNPDTLRRQLASLHIHNIPTDRAALLLKIKRSMGHENFDPAAYHDRRGYDVTYYVIRFFAEREDLIWYFKKFSNKIDQRYREAQDAKPTWFLRCVDSRKEKLLELLLSYVSNFDETLGYLRGQSDTDFLEFLERLFQCDDPLVFQFIARLDSVFINRIVRLSFHLSPTERLHMASLVCQAAPCYVGDNEEMFYEAAWKMGAAPAGVFLARVARDRGVYLEADRLYCEASEMLEGDEWQQYVESLRRTREHDIPHGDSRLLADIERERQKCSKAFQRLEKKWRGIFSKYYENNAYTDAAWRFKTFITVQGFTLDALKMRENCVRAIVGTVTAKNSNALARIYLRWAKELTAMDGSSDPAVKCCVDDNVRNFAAHCYFMAGFLAKRKKKGPIYLEARHGLAEASAEQSALPLEVSKGYLLLLTGLCDSSKGKAFIEECIVDIIRRHGEHVSDAIFEHDRHHDLEQDFSIWLREVIEAVMDGSDSTSGEEETRSYSFGFGDLSSISLASSAVHSEYSCSDDGDVVTVSGSIRDMTDASLTGTRDEPVTGADGYDTLFPDA